MKLRSSLLLTPFVILLFSAFVSDKVVSKNLVTGKDTAFVEVKVNYDFILSIPGNLQVTNELNTDATVQYENIYDELYIIVIDEPKADFAKAYRELGQYDLEKSPARNYREVQMKSMEEVITINSEKTINKMKINGLDAELVEFSGRSGGIDYDICYEFAFIEGKKNMYMVMTWTLESKKAKNKSKMDRMIRSFKLQLEEQ